MLGLDWAHGNSLQISFVIEVETAHLHSEHDEMSPLIHYVNGVA
jgi:hypothetical protein